MRLPETLVELLERAAAFPEAGVRFLDRREREGWTSWAEIHRAAGAAAAALAAAGVAPGDRVALVFPTGREFLDAFFGVLRAGAVPVPLPPPVRLGRRAEYHRKTAAMLRAAGARLVLVERRLERLLQPTIEAANAGKASWARCRTLDALRAAGNGFRPPGETPEDLALVQFSSGTTLDPKPVALSHRALVTQARILNGFWPDTGEVRHSGVSWLPLYHDMGLVGAVLPALERPGVLTLLAPEVFVTRPAAWLRALSRYRATISAAPGFAFRLAVEKVRERELEGVDLGAWRVALAGAEPLAPGVLRGFEQRFAAYGLRPEALTPVYGLAEAGLAVTFSELDRRFTTRRFDRHELPHGRARDAGDGLELPSLGRPVPGFEIRIVDDAGRPIPSRRVGRLQVRGPSLMEGYLGLPEATDQALRHGWLDTGDLGFVVDGELFLTGRAKEVVILRGRNHSPHEIEHAVEGVAGVRRDSAVAVSHLPEGAAGEVLLLFVESAPEAGEESVAEIPKSCREAVLVDAGLQVAEVHVLEPGTLPRTSSGKLRRGETLRRYLAGELMPAAPALAPA